MAFNSGGSTAFAMSSVTASSAWSPLITTNLSPCRLARVRKPSLTSLWKSMPLLSNLVSAVSRPPARRRPSSTSISRRIVICGTRSPHERFSTLQCRFPAHRRQCPDKPGLIMGRSQRTVPRLNCGLITLGPCSCRMQTSAASVAGRHLSARPVTSSCLIDSARSNTRLSGNYKVSIRYLTFNTARKTLYLCGFTTSFYALKTDEVTAHDKVLLALDGIRTRKIRNFRASPTRSNMPSSATSRTFRS